ncbi:hypothetical protein [Lysobacter gummosus]
MVPVRGLTRLRPRLKWGGVITHEFPWLPRWIVRIHHGAQQ